MCIEYTHLLPGLARTRVPRNTHQGVIFVFAHWLGCLLHAATLDQYSEIPFFLAVNPEGRSSSRRKAVVEREDQEGQGGPYGGGIRRQGVVLGWLRG